MKVCTVCKELKELDNYHNCKNSKDGKGYRCIQCDRSARRKYRDESPEKFSITSRRKRLKHLYNISLEDYEKLLAKQDYSCAICATTKNKVADNNHSFSVDHCHTTGKIRGLLCNQCNRGLGMLLDRVDILEKAVEYLKQNEYTKISTSI